MVDEGRWRSRARPPGHRAGDILAIGATPDASTALLAINRTGGIHFSCELPPEMAGTTVGYCSPLLLDQRWAIVEAVGAPTMPTSRLRVFDLPGEFGAAHGWVTERGSRSRSGRPLS